MYEVQSGTLSRACVGNMEVRNNHHKEKELDQYKQVSAIGLLVEPEHTRTRLSLIWPCVVCGIYSIRRDGSAVSITPVGCSLSSMHRYNL